MAECCIYTGVSCVYHHLHTMHRHCKLVLLCFIQSIREWLVSTIRSKKKQNSTMYCTNWDVKASFETATLRRTHQIHPGNSGRRLHWCRRVTWQCAGLTAQCRQRRHRHSYLPAPSEMNYTTSFDHSEDQMNAATCANQPDRHSLFNTHVDIWNTETNFLWHFLLQCHQCHVVSKC